MSEQLEFIVAVTCGAVLAKIVVAPAVEVFSKMLGNYHEKEAKKAQEKGKNYALRELMEAEAAEADENHEYNTFGGSYEQDVWVHACLDRLWAESYERHHGFDLGIRLGINEYCRKKGMEHETKRLQLSTKK